ncbi:putative secreted protein (Por secretion system target), partial [Dyadobacter jejuensis]
GAEASVAVAVSIPDMTTFATASNLRLVGWNGVEQSQDALHFIKLDQVRSSQIEGSGNTYTYSTTQPLGTSYYRLRMIDQDNTFAYSTLQSLTTTCGEPDATISVYPNPINADQQTVKVDYVTDYKGAASLSVINLMGQQLIDQSLQIDGPGTTSFGAAALHSGIYFVRLRDANGKTISSIQKLIKQ